MIATKIKILVVEDELILAMDLASTLTKEGYEVVGIAGNGIKALQLFNEHIPDIVICDIQLKGSVDGLSVVQQMKAIRPLPVIYLTAFTDNLTFERAKQTHPAAYLVKPYQLSNLRAAIELALYEFAQKVSSGDREAKNDDEAIAISRDNILRIDEAIFVKQQGLFTKILLADVLYVVSDSNYVVVHTTTLRYAIRLSLTTFLEKVNDKRLVRVQRSYAVNVSKVESFGDQEVTVNKTIIPLSPQYRNDFLRSFEIR